MFYEYVVFTLIAIVAGWLGGYVARWSLTVRQQACEAAVLDLGAKINSEVKKRAVGERWDQKKIIEEIQQTMQQRRLPMDPDEILAMPDR